jgi:spermidine synthase
MKGHHAGKIAGGIYAISTLGGIIATFAMGFYIIPNYGLSKPAFFIGLLLSLLPFFAILKNYTHAAGVVIVFMLNAHLLFKKNQIPSDIKILYQKEGILGQIMVVDYPVYEHKNTPSYYIKMMLFNRVIQAFYNKHDSAHTYFPYVKLIVDESVHLQKGKKVLLLGLGGGCVANELIKHNFEIDAVELDERVGKAAAKYFDLNPLTNVYIDDARRYINNTKKKYDLIIFDVFKGEENPAHIITQESLNAINNVLNPNGMIIINSYGFVTGEKSSGIKAIVNTVQHAGFQTHILPSSMKEEESNLLVFAKQKKYMFRFKTY